MYFSNLVNLFEQGFSNSSTIDTLDHYYGELSGALQDVYHPGRYLLDASSFPPLMTMCPDIGQHFPGRKLSLVDNHCFRAYCVYQPRM